LSFGFNWAKDQMNGGYNTNARGSFTFTNRYSSQVGAPGTGSAVADFLLGYPSNSSRGLGSGFRNLRQDRYGAYFQDDWKATSNLTLNLGIRYEYFQPGYEKRDNLSGFDPQTGAIFLAGEDGYPRGLRDSFRKGFQPRVGFAYRIGGSNRLVVRGGYGIYLMALTTGPYTLASITNEPFFTLQSFFGDTIIPNLTLKNAFPEGKGVPSTALNSVQRDFGQPYLQHWNLTVEQELARNLTLELAYLGNKGTKLPHQMNINQPPAGPGSLQSKRPFPAFSTINSYNSAAKSAYHSLSIKSQKRLSGGLAFLASYTWAKLLATGGIQHPGDLGNAPTRNPLDLNAEKGRDYFDVRNRFSGSFVWLLPFGKGQKFGSHWSSVIEHMLGGWQVNGILSLQSGLPITPVLGFDNSNTGSLQDRPNVTRDPNNGPRTVQKWFDTGAFELPPQFSYGNSGKNIIDGPPIKSFDFSVFKNWNIVEKISLQFRAEFFNLTNTPQFNPPGTTFGTASFGVISSAGDPRQIQFGLKLIF
jgi:outer membrane receptor protein involved in Fe transport